MLLVLKRHIVIGARPSLRLARGVLNFLITASNRFQWSRTLGLRIVCNCERARTVQLRRVHRHSQSLFAVCISERETKSEFHFGAIIVSGSFHHYFIGGLLLWPAAWHTTRSGSRKRERARLFASTYRTGFMQIIDAFHLTLARKENERRSLSLTQRRCTLRFNSHTRAQHSL